MGRMKQWMRTKLKKWVGNNEITAELNKLILNTENILDAVYNLPVLDKTGAGRRIATYEKDLFLLDPEFFSEYSEERARRLYYENVELTFIETHSYCNRTCWFCPNSTIDRKTKNQKMPEHIFNKVVSQLAEINYRGDLSFTLFNEPLADAEIEGKVKAAKKMLPNALLHFNTNGDFLSRERLASINDAGLDRLLISVYVDCDIEKPFDYDAALCATHSMAEKLGLPSIEVYTDPNEDQCLANVKFKDMNILFQSQNHRRQACSRGDVLPESAPVMRTSGRLKPCSFPYSMMCVSHDGKVGACCNIRNDYHEHGKYIVGDLNTESIYQIFLGKKLTDFRKKMINGVNAAPCGTCSFDWESVLMSMHNEPRRTIRKYRFTSL